MSPQDKKKVVIWLRNFCNKLETLPHAATIRDQIKRLRKSADELELEILDPASQKCYAETSPASPDGYAVATEEKWSS